jgi:hypothetical protein
MYELGQRDFVFLIRVVWYISSCSVNIGGFVGAEEDVKSNASIRGCSDTQRGTQEDRISEATTG